MLTKRKERNDDTWNRKEKERKRNSKTHFMEPCFFTFWIATARFAENAERREISSPVNVPLVLFITHVRPTTWSVVGLIHGAHANECIGDFESKLSSSPRDPWACEGAIAFKVSH